MAKTPRDTDELMRSLAGHIETGVNDTIAQLLPLIPDGRERALLAWIGAMLGALPHLAASLDGSRPDPTDVIAASRELSALLSKLYPALPAPTHVILRGDDN